MTFSYNRSAVVRRSAGPRTNTRVHGSAACVFTGRDRLMEGGGDRYAVISEIMYCAVRCALRPARHKSKMRAAAQDVGNSSRLFWKHNSTVEQGPVVG